MVFILGKILNSINLMSFNRKMKKLNRVTK